jgi:hypothetical protein
VQAGRLFWLVYLAVVAVTGVLGLAAIAFGDIGLYEGRVTGTAWAALLAGATFFAGLHLLGRVGPVAWAVVAGAPVAFALITNGIWSNSFSGNESKWAWTALVYVLVALIVAGLRLLIPETDPASRAAFIGSSLCFVIVGGLAIKDVWGSFGESGGDTRAGLAAFVLGVTGFLVAPALRRPREHADAPG